MFFGGTENGLERLKKKTAGRLARPGGLKKGRFIGW